jgi:hypothetical protein
VDSSALLPKKHRTKKSQDERKRFILLAGIESKLQYKEALDWPQRCTGVLRTEGKLLHHLGVRQAGFTAARLSGENMIATIPA